MFNNWKMPSIKDLKLEYFLEYQNKNLGRITNDAFPTEQVFLDAVKNAKVVSINSSTDSKIAYRSHTSSKSSLIALLKSYRSWPEFRNNASVDRMYNGFNENQEMPMSIVLKWKDSGKMRVFGGNTRLDVFFQLFPKGKAKVIMIEV